MPKISSLPTATLAKSTDILMLVQDGVTRQIPASFLGAKLPYALITRFSYAFNTSSPVTTDTAVNANKDAEVLDTDWAVLMLPTSYSPSGKPTRLVIGCHGGGGTVTSGTSQTESYSIYKYLVANGYAVMDCGGLPEAYALRNSIDWYRAEGVPFAVNSYREAYNYIINNFNIAPDGVMLTGGSGGGLMSHNIYAHSSIPILAMAGMSPLLSMADAWSIPTGAMSGGIFTAYQNRANIITLYGMTPVTTQEQLNAATLETDKVKGSDPLNYNCFVDNNANICKVHTVPYKIWHPVDDPVVDIDVSRAFVTRIQNAGGYAILREMASGGHAPETAGTQIGTFTYNGSTIALYPPMQELLYWFNRFNG